MDLLNQYQTLISRRQLLAGSGKVLGTAALSSGVFHIAQERYRQAIRTNPKSPVYWTNLAWAHIKARQFDSARTALVSALARDPGFGPAISLAQQLESGGDQIR